MTDGIFQLIFQNYLYVYESVKFIFSFFDSIVFRFLSTLWNSIFNPVILLLNLHKSSNKSYSFLYQYKVNLIEIHQILSSNSIIFWFDPLLFSNSLNIEIV